MAGIANFSIVIGGRDDYFRSCRPYEPEFMHLASSIAITLRMLSNPTVRRALEDLAMQFDATQTYSWYGKINYVRAQATQLVNAFLGKLYEEFPLVIIDETMDDSRTPGCLAFIQAQGWHGSFKPRDQTIWVNAMVCKAMIRHSWD